MLDDANYLRNIDSNGMLDALGDTVRQLEYDFKTDLSHIVLTSIKNVVYGGMGASAMAGVIAESWLQKKLNKPFTVVRGYDIPGWVDSSTLVIVSSFSGNTEESLSLYEQAMSAKASIVVMTDGGKLVELAKTNNHPLSLVPTALQPRIAVFYMLRALAEILEQAGIANKLMEQINGAANRLRSRVTSFDKSVPESDNLAKKIAVQAMGKNIEIFGGPLMFAAAYKWKIDFNENAKNVAFTATLPEFSHNEFIGWSSHPIDKPFAIFQLRSSFESERISRRYEIMNRLLSGKMPSPHIVQAEGETAIEQLLWTIVLGDFVSTYLAILNGQNPTPITLVEKLKQELAG